MTAHDGTIRENPPEIYESFFVPAVFRPWAIELLNRAGLHQGERVLDLGCGTGVVARTAAATVGTTGSVTGLDFNPAMLAVARGIPVAEGAAAITWIEGSASELPFPDGSFDLVTAQQVLQFVPDRLAALREAGRVLAPGGRIALAVWAGMQSHPFHEEVDAIIERHIGTAALKAGMIFPDPEIVRGLVEEAGLRVRSLEFISKDACYPDPATAARRFVLSTTAGIPSFRQLDVEDRDRFVDLISTDMADLIRRSTVGDEVIVPWRTHLAIADKV